MLMSFVVASSGPVVRVLTDPWATLASSAASVLAWLEDRVSFLAPAGVVVVVGLWWVLRRWHRMRLDAWHEHAQVVTIESPPTVSARGAQSLWANLAGLLLRPWPQRLVFGTPALAWEYVFTGERIAVRLWVPGTVAVAPVQRAVEAAWPGAHTRVQDNTPPLPPRAQGRRVVADGGTVRLARPEALPIRATAEQADPLHAVLAAPGALAAGDGACVQVLARPATGRRVARAHATTTPATSRGPNFGSGLGSWSRHGVRALLDLITPGAAATSPAGRSARSTQPRDPRVGMEASSQGRAMVDKREGLQCATLVRYAVTTTIPEHPSPRQRQAAQAQLRSRAHAISSSLAGYAGHNYYRPHRLPRPVQAVTRRDLGRGDLLSVPEVAGLAHLPDPTAAPGLAQAGAKALSPPAGVVPPGAHAKPLGHSDTGHGTPVGLRVADARHHLHVLGATGVGKSTLLAQLLLDDITRHRGVVVLDPKGDLVTDLLSRLPKEAADRLVLFDPNQPGPVPCLNPLHGGDRDLAVDQLVSVFRRVYAAFWGPRTDDVFRSACLTLRAQGGVATLADLPRLLDEPAFRARVTTGLSDPVLRGFWSWYESLSDSARTSVIAPLMNKLRSFLLRPFVRDALAGGPSTVDMGQILDGGICLVRIPKGQLGDETTRLVGSLVVAGVWQAATARAHLPHRQRHDASMVLDECQNFLNLPYSLEDMLAEARGYRLSLTLAHQHLGQLGRELREGIATNARSKIFFSVGPDDARELARHTAPWLSEHDLSHLAAFHAAARLVARGEEVPPCTLSTQPLPPVIPARAHQLRTHAAQHTSANHHEPTSGEAAGAEPEPDHAEAQRGPGSNQTDEADHPWKSTVDDLPRSSVAAEVREPDEIQLDPDPAEATEPPPLQHPERASTAPGRGREASAKPGARDPRR